LHCEKVRTLIEIMLWVPLLQGLTHGTVSMLWLLAHNTVSMITMPWIICDTHLSYTHAY